MRVRGLLLLLPLLVSCASITDDCDDRARYAVSVRVRDARTGAAIAAGATIVARDGAYADSVTVGSAPVFNDGWIPLAEGRPGTYDLTVHKAGYRDFVESGIRAPAGACGAVAEQTRTVRLEPST